MAERLGGGSVSSGGLSRFWIAGAVLAASVYCGGEVESGVSRSDCTAGSLPCDAGCCAICNTSANCEACGAHGTGRYRCADGLCSTTCEEQCTPHFELGCHDSDLVWLDSCGVVEEVVEPDATSCSTVEQCTGDVDCGPDAVCGPQDICVPKCSSGADCPLPPGAPQDLTMGCDGGGHCVPDPYGCAADEECLDLGTALDVAMVCDDASDVCVPKCAVPADCARPDGAPQDLQMACDGTGHCVPEPYDCAGDDANCTSLGTAFGSDLVCDIASEICVPKCAVAAECARPDGAPQDLQMACNETGHCAPEPYDCSGGDAVCSALGAALGYDLVCDAVNELCVPRCLVPADCTVPDGAPLDLEMACDGTGHCVPEPYGCAGDDAICASLGTALGADLVCDAVNELCVPRCSAPADCSVPDGAPLDLEMACDGTGHCVPEPYGCAGDDANCASLGTALGADLVCDIASEVCVPACSAPADCPIPDGAPLDLVMACGSDGHCSAEPYTCYGDDGNCTAVGVALGTDMVCDRQQDVCVAKCEVPEDCPALTHPMACIDTGHCIPDTYTGLFDFGGMWGWYWDPSGGATLLPNPTTGAGACPGGYDVLRILGADGIDWNAYLCYREHQPGRLVEWDFGGMIGSYAVKDQGLFQYESPMSSNNEDCPSGYAKQDILRSFNVDCPLSFCYREHEDDGYYLDFDGMVGATDDPPTPVATPGISLGPPLQCPTGEDPLQTYGSCVDSGCENLEDRAVFYCYREPLSPP